MHRFYHIYSQQRWWIILHFWHLCWSCELLNWVLVFLLLLTLLPIYLLVRTSTHVSIILSTPLRYGAINSPLHLLHCWPYILTSNWFFPLFHHNSTVIRLEVQELLHIWQLKEAWQFIIKCLEFSFGSYTAGFILLLALLLMLYKNLYGNLRTI